MIEPFFSVPTIGHSNILDYFLAAYLCVFTVKLNGGRAVTGVLRGFDPFMNLVIDESVEETKTGERHAIGMVVCILLICLFISYFHG